MTTNERHLKILDIFCIKKSKYAKLNPTKTCTKWLENHKNEIFDDLEYLKNYAQDLINATLYEQLYRIKYDLKTRPTCTVCGKYVKFLSFARGYQKHCCKKCSCDDLHNKTSFHEAILRNKIKKEPQYGCDLTKINDENDIIISNLFLLSNGNFDGNKLNESKRWCQKNKQFVDYIINRYSDTNSIQENVYRIVNHLDTRPICKVCGAPVKFNKFASGYNEYCSNSCAHKSNEYKEKYANTMLQKYGDDCVFKIKELREKGYKTFSKRLQNGYYNGGKSEISVYTSKHELFVYNVLKPLYDDILQYYRDDRYYSERTGYKWECDFYIPSLDLFIEVQGFPTHGDHPYNKANNDDKQRANELKEEHKIWINKNGGSTSFAKDILNTWTKLDVYKRYMAKKHGIKLLEIYPSELNKETIIDKLNKLL